jgi:hypothetical protein
MGNQTYGMIEFRHKGVPQEELNRVKNLQQDGWQVNHKRVERIWREEGLKVPKKQPKRGPFAVE